MPGHPDPPAARRFPLTDMDDRAVTEEPREQAPPAGFRLATPGNWFTLDLDPATRNQSIARLVNARIADFPQIAERRQEIIRMLRGAAREAAEHEVAFVSMMAEAADGPGMSASLTVVITPVAADDDGGGPVTDVESLRASLAGRSAPPQRVDVGCVELPAGTAVRLCGLRENDLPGGGESVVTSMVQYFIPVPDSAAFAVVTFSTPTLALAGPFTELFDAIASTFEFEDPAHDDEA